ncbi:hypothetical protein GT755_08075 [Herbidospora sp. NEAU-GS84]|uniref:Uncharacterized protein n=1 Tax=Herbidospora solisilvae TaxID=2696284 RepID=A0A7C9J286_9ACTN|nr:hypothetical protein [Herbidospora solisilvae]NAS21640.1 hypothetical protein [Herbidospora solisilvae]
MVSLAAGWIGSLLVSGGAPALLDWRLCVAFAVGADRLVAAPGARVRTMNTLLPLFPLVAGGRRRLRGDAAAGGGPDALTRRA